MTEFVGPMPDVGELIKEGVGAAKVLGISGGTIAAFVFSKWVVVPMYRARMEAVSRKWMRGMEKRVSALEGEADDG